MCQEGLVYGVATDDMDALTFGAPKLVRHLVAPGQGSAKPGIDEYDMAALLEGMGLTQVRASLHSLALVLPCSRPRSLPAAAREALLP